MSRWLKVNLYISGAVMYNHHYKEGNNMSTDRARYTVSLDDDMFQKVEDFRFDNRFQTRSQATVELIRLGLEAVERKKGEGKAAED